MTADPKHEYSARRALVAPPAIAAAYVFSLYGASAVPLDYVWRPLGVAAAALLIEAPAAQ